MSLGNRIRERRQKMDLSQSDLARMVGVSQQAINNLENGGATKSRHIAGLARALDVTVDFLLDGPTEHTLKTGSSPVTQGSAPEVPQFLSLPRDVPVYGQVVGGDDGNFFFNGETIDYFRRPPGAAMMRDVYGLYVTGSSMWPKFEDGDPIYASPSRVPAIGDYVVIEVFSMNENGLAGAFVKRLLKRTPTKIICEQFNPHQQVEFERDRIKSLHRIMPLIELIGT